VGEDGRMERFLAPRGGWVALLCLALGWGSGACSTGEAPGAGEGEAAVEVIDDAGRPVRLATPARRVVSLVPAMTESILALGAGARLVARTRYDEAPELADLPDLGGGLDPSIEALVELAPGLVIAWRSPDDRGLRARLEAAGIPVYAVSMHDTNGVFRSLERLGKLFDLESRADSVAGAIRDTLAAVARDAIPERPSVFYMLGGDPPRTTGPETFVAQVIGVAGARSLFPDLPGRWPAVSLEEVVDRDPDIVLVPVDPGSPVPAALGESPGWKRLRAIRLGRVATFDANLLNRPGPGLGRAARAVRDTLASVLARTAPR